MGHARDLLDRDIPAGGKTVIVPDNEYDDEGVLTREGTREVAAPYCYRTEDGKWVSCAKDHELHFSGLARGQGITLMIDKYGIDGTFMGGPFAVEVATERGLYL